MSMRTPITVAVSVAAGAALYHSLSNVFKASAITTAVKTLADGSSRDIILGCRYGKLDEKPNLRGSHRVHHLNLQAQDEKDDLVLFYSTPRPCLPFDSSRPFAKPMDIRAEHVVQGTWGNCALMGTLTAIADTWPDYIENMIRQIDAQYYAVSLYNSKGDPVEIVVSKRDLESKRYQGSVVDMERPWPRLLAIAMEKLTNRDQGVNGQTSTINGAWGKDYLFAIFGRESDRYEAMFFESDFGEQLKGDPVGFTAHYNSLLKAIADSVNSKQLLNGGKVLAPLLTIMTFGGERTHLVLDGFPDNHTMSIHRFVYDPKNPESAYVEVRNAWAKNSLEYLSEPLRGAKVERKIGKFDSTTLWKFLQNKGRVIIRVDFEVIKTTPDDKSKGISL